MKKVGYEVFVAQGSLHYLSDAGPELNPSPGLKLKLNPMATYFAWTMTMLELPEFGPICHDRCTSDPEVFDREMLRAWEIGT